VRPEVKELAAAALTLLCFSLPATLLAKERRGADLVVTRTNGQQVIGELIAVKPNSLLLLGPARKDESVNTVDIKSIKIVRKSRAGMGVVLGLVSGALGGALWGHHEAGGDEDGLYVFGGALLFGGVGALTGLVAGVAAGLDDEIVLSGQPESVVRSSLARLSRHAREPGAMALPQRTQATATVMRETGAGANARPEGTFQPPKTPRFRLTWAAANNLGAGYSFSTPASGTFRFSDNLPPGDTGPFPMEIWAQHSRPRFTLGCVGLAYEWNRYWSSEIELYAPASHETDTFGSPEFTSGLDGKSYYSSYGFLESVSSISLLVGLTFRPLPPEFLQRHVIEAGVAAGPAFIQVAKNDVYAHQKPTIRNMTWTARVRAAYDFYFVPAFSMGAFAEYRWLKADIPEYTATADLFFYDVNDPNGVPLRRTTDVTIPGIRVALGGFACGLRLGLRF
jgi:hypothetical protein